MAKTGNGNGDAILDTGETRTPVAKPSSTAKKLVGKKSAPKKPPIPKIPAGPGLAGPKPPMAPGMAMANRAKPQLAIGQRPQLGPRVRAALRR